MAPPPAIAEHGQSPLRHELAGNDLELEGSALRVELLGIEKRGAGEQRRVLGTCT